MKANNVLIASGTIRTTKDITDENGKVIDEVSSVKDYDIRGGHIWSGIKLGVRDSKEVTNPKNGNSWFPWIANFNIKTLDESVAMELIALDKQPATVRGYLKTENVTPDAKNPTFVQFFYVTEVASETSESEVF